MDHLHVGVHRQAEGRRGLPRQRCGVRGRGSAALPAGRAAGPGRPRARRLVRRLRRLLRGDVACLAPRGLPGAGPAIAGQGGCGPRRLARAAAQSRWCRRCRRLRRCGPPTSSGDPAADLRRRSLSRGAGEPAGRALPGGWNTDGPTETTVVACAARMSVDEPVRIGLPLDGWQVAVVDPDSRQPVEWGEVGELVIGGVGTARYLDPEKDAAKFRPLPALGWDRAYCSGDLVRADPEGLGFVGRADTQVEIRGYRIELSEIESVLLQVPGIVQAVVTTYEPQPGLVELVGYYSSGSDAVAVDQHQVYQRLRSRLPAHMVPAYLEELAVIPTMTSGKADRKKLPAPSGRRGLTDRQVYVAPATATETILAEALAEVLGLDAGVGGQPLLRRPRRQLVANGALLRPGQEAGRAAAAGHTGCLPAPDGPGPGRSPPGDGTRRPVRARRARRPGSARRHGALRPVRRAATPDPPRGGLRRLPRPRRRPALGVARARCDRSVPALGRLRGARPSSCSAPSRSSRNGC